MDVSLHGRIEDYRIYFENLSFSSFSHLMEAARPSIKFVIRTSRSMSPIQSTPKKRSMIAAVDKNMGAKDSHSKKVF